MAIENFTDPELVQILIDKVSNLTTFFQAVGGIILAYLIFSAVNLWINRKKKKEMEKINNNLEDIKKLLKKKK
ncbi:MAG: hypothetical protein Q8P15_03745 [Nanoarchaeota archaeon]|nr:hypothetical protein [Nanoarchaeota archaeon]